MDSSDDASPSRSQKRKRDYYTAVNDERNEFDAEDFKNGSVWLDDGNIILVAKGEAFKVHQSVLARHSEVFRDMLKMPQPTNDQGADKCPIVPLSDSTKELEHILSALYDGGNQ